MATTNGYVETSVYTNLHKGMLDLRAHSAPRYWADLLLCAIVFWTLMVFAGQSRSWLPIVLIAGSLALYRMAMFAHEICHFKGGNLPGFVVIWNAVCGIPMLFPSFMLKSHVDHHSTRSYGTPSDPEYLPFGTCPQLRPHFLFGSALVPVALAIRALILVPLAWFTPSIRMHLRERLTFMSMNNAYKPDPYERLTGVDHAIEVMISVWAWGWLVAAVTGAVRWHIVTQVFACMSLAFLLNGWRTLQAHRYESNGLPIDAKAQLRDSTTFIAHWLLGELLCPVGQRFHAAHHLFPYLPYHALPEAHRRLISTEWVGKADYLTTFVSPFRTKRKRTQNG